MWPTASHRRSRKRSRLCTRTVSNAVGCGIFGGGWVGADESYTALDSCVSYSERRKNMEEPNVVDTGVAVARSTRTGRYYGVQMFGRPAKASFKFSVENRSRNTLEYRIGSRSYSISPRMVRTHQECVPGELQFH